ncbi:hypothetical protein [Nissabacter sp. SGAir0207]|uniref:hypothetical protein n=1 Tax=Nissabacter sp. SGAir0207 TaxID=2126321 RepID=UPI0010F50898|nr:hypothetical protein [Nissabacter sp. SGAir0207]
MGKNKYITFSLLFSLCPFLTDARSAENPVQISKGPFAQSVSLNPEQENYSSWWKKQIKSQLNKPVNFAGHYRLFVTSGGHGSECLHDYWVCGWVIDKLTGKVVATLPRSPEGGDSYVEAVDDGTSTGLKFKYTAEGDSKELTIQGRAANAPLQHDNGDFAVPKCRLITYRFNGSGFDTLNEVSNGCNLSEPNVIYGH